MAAEATGGHKIKLYGNHHVDARRQVPRRAWDVFGDRHLNYCNPSCKRGRWASFISYDDDELVT